MIMTNNMGLTYRDIVQCYHSFFLRGNNYVTPFRPELLRLKKEKVILRMLDPIAETKLVNWEIYYQSPSRTTPTKSALYCLSEAYWVVL